MKRKAPLTCYRPAQILFPQVCRGHASSNRGPSLNAYASTRGCSKGAMASMLKENQYSPNIKKSIHINSQNTFVLDIVIAIFNIY